MKTRWTKEELEKLDLEDLKKLQEQLLEEQRRARAAYNVEAVKFLGSLIAGIAVVIGLLIAASPIGAIIALGVIFSALTSYTAVKLYKAETHFDHIKHTLNDIRGRSKFLEAQTKTPQKPVEPQAERKLDTQAPARHRMARTPRPSELEDELDDQEEYPTRQSGRRARPAAPDHSARQAQASHPRGNTHPRMPREFNAGLSASGDEDSVTYNGSGHLLSPYGDQFSSNRPYAPIQTGVTQDGKPIFGLRPEKGDHQPRHPHSAQRSTVRKEHSSHRPGRIVEELDPDATNQLLEGLEGDELSDEDGIVAENLHYGRRPNLDDKDPTHGFVRTNPRSGAVSRVTGYYPRREVRSADNYHDTQPPHTRAQEFSPASDQHSFQDDARFDNPETQWPRDASPRHQGTAFGTEGDFYHPQKDWLRPNGTARQAAGHNPVYGRPLGRTDSTATTPLNQQRQEAAPSSFTAPSSPHTLHRRGAISQASAAAKPTTPTAAALAQPVALSRRDSASSDSSVVSEENDPLNNIGSLFDIAPPALPAPAPAPSPAAPVADEHAAVSPTAGRDAAFVPPPPPLPQAPAAPVGQPTSAAPLVPVDKTTAIRLSSLHANRSAEREFDLDRLSENSSPIDVKNAINLKEDAGEKIAMIVRTMPDGSKHQTHKSLEEIQKLFEKSNSEKKYHENTFEVKITENNRPSRFVCFVINDTGQVTVSKGFNNLKSTTAPQDNPYPEVRHSELEVTVLEAEPKPLDLTSASSPQTDSHTHKRSFGITFKSEKSTKIQSLETQSPASMLTSYEGNVPLQVGAEITAVQVHGEEKPRTKPQEIKAALTSAAEDDTILEKITYKQTGKTYTTAYIPESKAAEYRRYLDRQELRIDESLADEENEVERLPNATLRRSEPSTFSPTSSPTPSVSRRGSVSSMSSDTSTATLDLSMFDPSKIKILSKFIKTHLVSEEEFKSGKKDAIGNIEITEDDTLSLLTFKQRTTKAKVPTTKTRIISADELNELDLDMFTDAARMPAALVSLRTIAQKNGWDALERRIVQKLIEVGKENSPVPATMAVSADQQATINHLLSHVFEEEIKLKQERETNNMSFFREIKDKKGDLITKKFVLSNDEIIYLEGKTRAKDISSQLRIATEFFNEKAKHIKDKTERSYWQALAKQSSKQAASRTEEAPLDPAQVEELWAEIEEDFQKNQDEDVPLADLLQTHSSAPMQSSDEEEQETTILETPAPKPTYTEKEKAATVLKFMKYDLDTEANKQAFTQLKVGAIGDLELDSNNRITFSQVTSLYGVGTQTKKRTINPNDLSDQLVQDIDRQPLLALKGLETLGEKKNWKGFQTIIHKKLKSDYKALKAETLDHSVPMTGLGRNNSVSSENLDYLLTDLSPEKIAELDALVDNSSAPASRPTSPALSRVPSMVSLRSNEDEQIAAQPATALPVADGQVAPEVVAAPDAARLAVPVVEPVVEPVAQPAVRGVGEDDAIAAGGALGDAPAAEPEAAVLTHNLPYTGPNFADIFSAKPSSAAPINRTSQSVTSSKPSRWNNIFPLRRTKPTKAAKTDLMQALLFEPPFTPEETEPRSGSKPRQAAFTDVPDIDGPLSVVPKNPMSASPEIELQPGLQRQAPDPVVQQAMANVAAIATTIREQQQAPAVPPAPASRPASPELGRTSSMVSKGSDEGEQEETIPEHKQLPRVSASPTHLPIPTSNPANMAFAAQQLLAEQRAKETQEMSVSSSPRDTLTPVPKDGFEKFGISLEGKKITSVEPDSIAWNLDLEVGDVLESIRRDERKSKTNPESMMQALEKASNEPTRQFTVQVKRGQTSMEGTARFSETNATSISPLVRIDPYKITNTKGSYSPKKVGEQFDSLSTSPLPEEEELTEEASAPTVPQPGVHGAIAAPVAPRLDAELEAAETALALAEATYAAVATYAAAVTYVTANPVADPVGHRVTELDTAVRALLGNAIHAIHVYVAAKPADPAAIAYAARVAALAQVTFDEAEANYKTIAKPTTVPEVAGAKPTTVPEAASAGLTRVIEQARAAAATHAEQARTELTRVADAPPAAEVPGTTPVAELTVDAVIPVTGEEPVAATTTASKPEPIYSQVKAKHLRDPKPPVEEGEKSPPSPEHAYKEVENEWGIEFATGSLKIINITKNGIGDSVGLENKSTIQKLNIDGKIITDPTTIKERLLDLVTNNKDTKFEIVTTAGDTLKRSINQVTGQSSGAAITEAASAAPSISAPAPLQPDNIKETESFLTALGANEISCEKKTLSFTHEQHTYKLDSKETTRLLNSEDKKQVLQDIATSHSSGLFRTDKAAWKKLSRELKKPVIGNPTDFRHEGHIGYSPEEHAARTEAPESFITPNTPKTKRPIFTIPAPPPSEDLSQDQANPVSSTLLAAGTSPTTLKALSSDEWDQVWSDVDEESLPEIEGEEEKNNPQTRNVILANAVANFMRNHFNDETITKIKTHDDGTLSFVKGKYNYIINTNTDMPDDIDVGIFASDASDANKQLAFEALKNVATSYDWKSVTRLINLKLQAIPNDDLGASAAHSSPSLSSEYTATQVARVVSAEVVNPQLPASLVENTVAKPLTSTEARKTEVLSGLLPVPSKSTVVNDTVTPIVPTNAEPAVKEEETITPPPPAGPAPAGPLRAFTTPVVAQNPFLQASSQGLQSEQSATPPNPSWRDRVDSSTMPLKAPVLVVPCLDFDETLVPGMIFAMVRTLQSDPSSLPNYEFIGYKHTYSAGEKRVMMQIRKTSHRNPARMTRTELTALILKEMLNDPTQAEYLLNGWNLVKNLKETYGNVYCTTNNDTDVIAAYVEIMNKTKQQAFKDTEELKFDDIIGRDNRNNYELLGKNNHLKTIKDSHFKDQNVEFALFDDSQINVNAASSQDQGISARGFKICPSGKSGEKGRHISEFAEMSKTKLSEVLGFSEQEICRSQEEYRTQYDAYIQRSTGMKMM